MANIAKTGVDYFTKRRESLLKKMMNLDVTPTELRKWWLAKHRNLSVHSYDKDLTYCKKQLNRLVHDEKENIINDHIMKYDKNYKEALLLGNIQGANQALSFKEKVLGLHRPENQTFIQHNSFNLETLSEEQIDRILEQGKEEE